MRARTQPLDTRVETPDLISMPEVWLRPNRRVLALAMIPMVAVGAVSLALWKWGGGMPPGWICLTIAIFTAGLLLGLLRELGRPRIAYREGSLLFRLKAGKPFAVPLHVVEAFFQGEGLAHLPGESQHQAKSVNLIARLSQRDTQWHQRDVKTALGRWEEGYITVRGTWCEPITQDVIRRLNRRLTEVKREEQEKSEGGEAV